MSDAQDAGPVTPVEIYLSHARGALPLARVIGRYLRSAGLNVKVDGEAPPGAGLATREQAVARSDFHLLLLTDTTPGRWQLAELDFAERSAARYRRLQIVPLCREGFDGGELTGRIDRFDPLTLPADREALDEALRALVERLREPAGSLVSAPPAPVNPFRGLRPYGLGDGRYFFGREREIVDAVDRLGELPGEEFRRWLRVEGPAGCGKASFARAGITPALIRGAVPGTPSDWRVAALRPTDHPIEALIAALSAALGGSPTPSEVQETLEQSGLSDLITEHLPADQGLLLVIDHLEDLVTEAHAHPTALATFDRVLSDGIGDFDRRLWLVTTCRDDLVGAVYDQLPRLAEWAITRSSVVHLGNPGRGAFRVIVEGPTQLVGRPWSADLIDRIVAEAEQITTPLPRLAWLLHTLADGGRPDLARYEALGGVAHGLERALDRLLGESEDERDRARRLLLTVVSAGRGHGDTPGSIQPADALRAAGGGPRAEAILARLEGSVDTGAEARTSALMVSQEPGREETLRLAHDCLLAVWPQLRRWAASARPAIERRAVVEAAFVSWVDAEQAPESLPRGLTLALLVGEDLTPDLRHLLRMTLPEAHRRFIEQAEAAEAAARDLQGTSGEAAREAEVQTLIADAGRARRQSSRLRIAFLLMLAFAAGLAALLLHQWNEADTLEAQISSMAVDRRRAAAELDGIERRLIEEEEARREAEQTRTRVERQRRQADQVGVAEAQNADDVLYFAIDTAVDADDLFRRLAVKDAAYARRTFAQGVVDRLERRLSETPGNDRLRYLLARQHLLVGDLAAETKRGKQAIGSYEKAVGVLQALAATEPPEPGYLQALADALDRLADYLAQFRDRRTHSDEEVRAAYDRAVAAHERLLELEPDVVQHAEAAWSTRERRAQVLIDMGSTDAALRDLVDLVAKTQAAVEARPQNRTLLHALVRRITMVGDIEASRRNIARALEIYETASTRLAPLLADLSEDERGISVTNARLRRKIKYTRAGTP